MQYGHTGGLCRCGDDEIRNRQSVPAAPAEKALDLDGSLEDRLCQLYPPVGELATRACTGVLDPVSSRMENLEIDDCAGRCLTGFHGGAEPCSDLSMLHSGKSALVDHVEHRRQ